MVRSDWIPCPCLGRLLFGHVKFAYRMNTAIPVSVRFSLVQTLRGEQYQFIETTIYPPSLTSPRVTQKISKRRIEPRSRRVKFMLCQASRCATHRPTERSHCGSIVVAELILTKNKKIKNKKNKTPDIRLVAFQARVISDVTVELLTVSASFLGIFIGCGLPVP